MQDQCFKVILDPYPSREERTVLELAQVESNEKRSSHEDQGEQCSVGLALDLQRHRQGAVVQHEGDIFCGDAPVCAVVKGAAFQGVLLENLPDDTEGSN